jgi:phage terminase large subunit-like protein
MEETEGKLREFGPELEKEYPLFFLEMNRAQDGFIRIKNKKGGTPRRRLLECGNKVGKTYIGIGEDLAHSFGKRVWLSPDDPDYLVDVKVPNKGVIGCETLQHSVMEKIWPVLKELIPKTCQYQAKKNPQGVIQRISFLTDPEGQPCESEIFIRSYDQEAEDYEGIDVDWAHWDEPPPRAILQAAERGKVVTNAPSWFTMTPLKEAYIYDEYSLKAANNGGEDDEIAVFRGEIWDNCQDWCRACNKSFPENGKSRATKVCPGCNKVLGFIPRAGIDEYLKTLDPEEREAREKGLWKHLSGLVYKNLDREQHVYADFPIPKNWMHIEGIDPHDARPTAYLYGAVSPEEIEIDKKTRHRIYWYDYLKLKGDMDTIVRDIKMKREKHGYSKPVFVMMDAKYGERTEMEGRCWESELRKRGIGFIKLSESKPGDVELGHKLVREYLNMHHSTLLGKTKPGMLFAKDGCSGTGGPLHSMFNYQYKEDADKPDEQFKDFPDIIRYVAIEQPMYRSVESEAKVVSLIQERMNKAIKARRMG